MVRRQVAEAFMLSIQWTSVLRHRYIAVRSREADTQLHRAVSVVTCLGSRNAGALTANGRPLLRTPPRLRLHASLAEGWAFPTGRNVHSPGICRPSEDKADGPRRQEAEGLDSLDGRRSSRGASGADWPPQSRRLELTGLEGPFLTSKNGLENTTECGSYSPSCSLSTMVFETNGRSRQSWVPA